MNKKTIIIGATTNPSRYAYMAAGMLTEYNHEIVPIGIKKGVIFGREILSIQDQPIVDQVDTVTLYIGPQHQPQHYEYILRLKSKRVIFNPGTENSKFQTLLQAADVEVLEACTLVLLRSGQY